MIVRGAAGCSPQVDLTFCSAARVRHRRGSAGSPRSLCWGRRASTRCSPRGRSPRPSTSGRACRDRCRSASWRIGGLLAADPWRSNPALDERHHRMNVGQGFFVWIRSCTGPRSPPGRSAREGRARSLPCPWPRRSSVNFAESALKFFTVVELHALRSLTSTPTAERTSASRRRGRERSSDWVALVQGVEDVAATFDAGL